MTAVTVAYARAVYHWHMESANGPSCLDCSVRPERLFCDLPPEALAAFDAIKSLALYPRNAKLFEEGSPARRVFVLCEGRARLTVHSENGRQMTVRIAGPGEVLGLSACLSGAAHEVTAETMDQAKVAQVPRKEIAKFLRRHREACFQVVRMLSQDLHNAYDRVRSIGLARSRRSRGSRVHFH